MPRESRQPEELEATCARILEAATELIVAEGFEGLSMRKLARRLGMTAPNIYNYFRDKNALYLAIQTFGFESLGRAFRDIAAQDTDAVARLEGFARAYVDFGLQHSSLYDVMLGRNTPKYADYVGTTHEGTAWTEKRAALAVIEFTETVIVEAALERGVVLDVPPRLHALRLWCSLHGLVSLLNTRVLQEVTDDAGAIVDLLIDDLRAKLAAPDSEPEPMRTNRERTP